MFWVGMTSGQQVQSPQNISTHFKPRKKVYTG